MDPEFNNEFMNITSVQELQDRSTVKIAFMPAFGCSSQEYPSSYSSSTGSPENSLRNSSVSSFNSSGSNSTISLEHSDSELRNRAWPREFSVPQFPHSVEIQLQRGNDTFKASGTTLKINPGLKSDILEKLLEEIFLYTAYPQGYQIDEVAAALIKKFPCLQEPSATGYYGWMISLKYKMANYRTKMRMIGCPEVTINSLKNKLNDGHPAKNVKKPKKAEVNFCPSHPVGETDETLENLRLELLCDVEQRNHGSFVREKMSRTFSYRRREVVQGSPTAAELKARWPALFCVNEVNPWCPFFFFFSFKDQNVIWAT